MTMAGQPAPTTSNVQMPGLLRLPLELRNQIYRYLIPTKRIIEVSPPRFKYTISKWTLGLDIAGIWKHENSPSTGIRRAWSRVCRHICARLLDWTYLCPINRPSYNVSLWMVKCKNDQFLIGSLMYVFGHRHLRVHEHEKAVKLNYGHLHMRWYVVKWPWRQWTCQGYIRHL